MSLTFSKTPTVMVIDNRGLTVRGLAYYRHPDAPDDIQLRINRHHFNSRGALTRSFDPRLYETGRANFSYLTDLAGRAQRVQGVDNGTSVSLKDAAGRPFIAISNIRTADDGTDDLSQAVTHSWQYEDAALPGRPLSVTEQVTGEALRITERFVYAGNTDGDKARNLAGQCLAHYDTAGVVQTNSVALTGVPLSVTRTLLKDADNPNVIADWQGADTSVWNDLLDREAQTTMTTADATGAVLTTTDAKGNIQRVAYDVAGQLSGSWLTRKGGDEQVIVKSLSYSAAGQKLREEHGNGVVTTCTYEPETQRLTGIKTERPAGHMAGAKVLQDLRYEYDPVGNVLKVRNDAEVTRFWRNQKVVPENTYTYDSLYQLVRATGREMANAGQQGSSLPAAIPLSSGDGACTSYIRTYAYDNAGNLTQIRHCAAATNNSYATNITVSDKSNRGVLSTLTENVTEVDRLFTAGGQQTQLQPGQMLTWNPRNELLKVTPVARDGRTDDREIYRYDGGSQRVLKVSEQRTGNSTQTQCVQYLPGLELRTTKSGETEKERLQVIVVGEAGRAQVRVLHWETGKPQELSNGQVRYSYDNLTGNGMLELDGDGKIISTEEYYPYGGTAIWTARSAVEANYKTVRFSGKERDATGLYYYGYRYYQPWAGRWLSSDPAGTIDGQNLFRMCRNNPVIFVDYNGLAPGFSDNKLHYVSTMVDRVGDLINQGYEFRSQGGGASRNYWFADPGDRLTKQLFKHARENWKKGHGGERNIGISQSKELYKTIMEEAQPLFSRAMRKKIQAESAAELSKKRAEQELAAIKKQNAPILAVSAVWAIEHSQIQAKSTKTFSANKFMPTLVKTRYLDDNSSNRNALELSSPGITQGLNALDGKSYNEIGCELDSVIQKERDFSSTTLYRGVDKDEWGRWLNAGGSYNPGRFIAFSSSKKAASKFVNPGGGLIILEQGGESLFIPGLYANENEQEQLFSTDARFYGITKNGNQITTRYQRV